MDATCDICLRGRQSNPGDPVGKNFVHHLLWITTWLYETDLGTRKFHFVHSPGRGELWLICPELFPNSSLRHLHAAAAQPQGPVFSTPS